MPRVSIVIRTKDRPVMLARALENVLGQSWTDWQMVIVNDGGEVPVLEATLAPFQQRLADRVTVVHNSESSGRPAAANRGFERATGEFVAVHDDDDLWHPEFLQRTVGHLERHPADVAVVVQSEIVDERAEAGGFVEVARYPFGPPADVVSLVDLILINRMVPISMLLRRDVLEELGGWDETLLCVEDWEFNLRLATAGPIGYLHGEPLAFWMQRPSVTDGPMATSMVGNAKEHYEFDRLVRERALRAGDRHHEIGQLLYLSKFIDEQAKAAEGRVNARIDDLRRDVEYYSLGATVRRALRRVGRRGG